MGKHVNKIKPLKQPRKITNAEKYASNIAKMAANDLAACKVFAVDHDTHDLPVCDTCPLKGICCNEEKMYEWLLKEVER